MSRRRRRRSKPSEMFFDRDDFMELCGILDDLAADQHWNPSFQRALDLVGNIGIGLGILDHEDYDEEEFEDEDDPFSGN